MRFLPLFLLVFLASQVAASTPPTWQELPLQSRQLYSDAIAPLRAQGFEPADDYTFFRELALESESTDLPTTMTAVQDRFLQLDVAGAVLRSQLLATVDNPTTPVLVAFAEKHADRFDPRDSLILNSIFIRKNGPGGAEAARKLAAEARRDLDSGMPFDVAAMRYSEARSRSANGQSGTIHRGEIAPETDKIVFGLKEGVAAGPFEREHGFYFFRVRDRKEGFSTARASDLAEAARLWRKGAVAEKSVGISEAHRLRVQLQVRNIPETTDWFHAPWIESADGRSEPFGLAFFNTARGDLDLRTPSPWSDYWADEAAFFREATFLNLAAEQELGPNNPQVSAMLEMLRTVTRGENRLRVRYAALQPDEATLQREFAAHGQELFPPIPLYSFLAWQVPLPKTGDATTSTTREVTQLADRLLTELHTSTKDAEPKSEAEARALFADLQAKYPGSRMESFKRLDSLGPFVDSILFRTEPGRLSRPFDQPSSVGLVYMISRDQDVATFDRVRDQLVVSWRREQLRLMVEGMKARLGIASK